MCHKMTWEGVSQAHMKIAHRRILAMRVFSVGVMFPCVLTPWLFVLWLHGCICSQTHTLLLFELHLGLMLALLEWLDSPPFPNQVGNTKEQTLFNLLCRSWTSLVSQTKVPHVWLTQKVAALPQTPLCFLCLLALSPESSLENFCCLSSEVSKHP